MKILAIETSCDETGVAVLETTGEAENAEITVLGNALYSQAALHAEYGGVYPNLAKREHQANLPALTSAALKEAGLFKEGNGIEPIPETAFKNVRDPEFKAGITSFLESCEPPAIDLIAVTRGPGLEPALWTGINFAVALSKTWKIPIIGIDHMEGHAVSALLSPKDPEKTRFELINPALPMMALLISGGHTEFILMKDWFAYEHIGSTKDDAVGEAFDKVARLLGLQYPGGPKVAEFAARSRGRGENSVVFPRPMADDNTCDLSFSGLKTAVLYKLKKMPEISESDKEHIAEAFENAARDVLTLKAERALSANPSKSFVIAGGVSANEEIRRSLTEMAEREFPGLALYMPDSTLTGDNAVMIGAAAYLRAMRKQAEEEADLIEASGSKRIFD